MPKINTYRLDEIIKPVDLVIGSSYDGQGVNGAIYSTRNYRLSDLAEFFIGYDFNAGLSLTTIEGLVNQNISDISSLDTSISTLASRVTTNEGNITTNASNISGNASNISTNASNISTNVASILSLSGRVGSNETDIAVINSNISNRAQWDEAYSWGDHSQEGYLTSVSITESDPVFQSSPAGGITSGDIITWDTAFGWGNHATENYLKSGDISTLSDLNTIVTDATIAKAGDNISIFSNDAGYITEAGGGGEWGTITGTLSDQTDLQAALDAKPDQADLDTKLNNNANDTLNGTLTVGGTAVGATEGGQVNLTLPTGTTLSGSALAIDSFNDRLRIFETGTPNKGVYIDFTEAGNGTSSKIYHQGNLNLNDYVAVTGDTMTGELSINSSAAGLTSTVPPGNWAVRAYSNASNASGIYMSSTDNASLYLRDASGTIRTAINSSTTSQFTYGFSVGGVFTCTGNDIGIEGPSPRLQLTETGIEDWYLIADNGSLSISKDTTGGSKFVFDTSGTMSVRDQIALRNFISTANSERFQIEPTDFGVGKPRLYVKKDSTANRYSMGLWDGVNNSGRIIHNADLISASEEFSCSSVIFNPTSAIANALDFWGTDGTDGFMPNRSEYLGVNRPSLMLTRHTSGSSNYAFTTGMAAIFKGNNITESFLIDRNNSASVLDLQVGFPISSSTITWSRLVHTGDSFDFTTNSLTAQNFILYSDRSLKKNIDNIQPREHVLWRQFEMDGKLRYGVVADEVEEIYPEFVKEGDSGHKTVSYIDILVVENAKLRDKINDLESEIKEIKNILKNGA